MTFDHLSNSITVPSPGDDVFSHPALARQPLATNTAPPCPEEFAAVLLAIDSDSRYGTVHPLLTQALPLMELLHGESIRKATRELDFGNICELTGKDDNGLVIYGHRHAHWLPLSLFGRECIDHVLVWCKPGFSIRAIATLSSIRCVFAKDIDRLSINLAGMGKVSDVARQLGQGGNVRCEGIAPLQASLHWQSVTPLVLRKFVHRRGKKKPEGQIREELAQRGFPDPVRVQIWTSGQMRQHNLAGYILNRKPGKQQPPCAASWGATLEFPKPQSGPICLGYGSHFGLGMFAAVQ